LVVTFFLLERDGFISAPSSSLSACACRPALQPEVFNVGGCRTFLGQGNFAPLKRLSAVLPYFDGHYALIAMMLPISSTEHIIRR
jgi:hypothetical protein